MADGMNRYLLRVEGVNLGDFVYDTDDLSTVRGGGLLLLHAIDEVKKWLLEEDPGTKSISTGASAGLFELSVLDGGAVRGRIAEKLKGDSQLKHATFVVDVTPLADPKCFLAAREAALALNRFRQMRAPSVAVPERVTNPKVTKACVVDMVRPGELLRPHKTRDVGQPMSRSVDTRRGYGVNQKQKFYRDATRDPGTGQDDLGVGEMAFVHDFESLATDETKGDVESHGNLNKKMAVIYVDGNHFGTTQEELCRTPGQDPIAMQIGFDTKLKDLRREALKAQLAAMRANTGSWRKGGEYRFETLLWGGDEFCWVVPAWCGWETLARFFDLSQEWKVEDRTLTHAAGIVFCHHKAPIRRIQGLAHRLAELAKQKSREVNLVAYQVLESFDDIPQDLKTFRCGRCSHGADPASLLAPGGGMSSLAALLGRLKNVVPKSRLVHLVHELQSGGPAAGDDLDDLLSLIGEDNTREVTALESVLGAPATVWFHLAELWDYLPAEQSPMKGERP